jgi:lysophospholipase
MGGNKMDEKQTMTQVPVFDDSRIPDKMDHVVVPAITACLQHVWTDVGDRGVKVTGVSDGVHHGIHSVFIPVELHAFKQGDAVPQDVSSAGTILIVPGFSESWPKFTEMAWYMAHWGFNVVIMENRGHGQSLREVADPELITVHHWESYVSDVAAVAANVRRVFQLTGPFFLFGHSMGGAITLAVLEQHSDLFTRAVASSPMLLPVLPMPATVAWTVSGLAAAFGQGDKPIPGNSNSFDAAMDAEDQKSATGSDDGSHSPHRAMWYRARRRALLCRHTLNPSWNWLHQALSMDRTVMKSASISKIITPFILFGAGQDQLVRLGEEGEFVTRARTLGVPVTYHVFPTARHEIYTDTMPVLTTYLHTIRQFFTVGKEDAQ